MEVELLQKMTKKSWIWLGIALCAIVVAGVLIVCINSYGLPVDPEQVEAVTIYRGSAETMEKKYVTQDDDIAMIIKKLDSTANLGGYKMPTEPAAGNRHTYVIFHLKDGSYFACTVRDDQYYSDGTVKMRTWAAPWQTLWDVLDDPAEHPGYPEQDGYTVPSA